jgi:hypothetical protein
MNTVCSERPISRAVVLVLYVLPIVYGAGILSVVVHEILGHRLEAILLDGKFYSFILKWHAITWAYSPLTSTPSQQHQIFGVISESVSFVKYTT